MADPTPDTACGVLTIDLGAVVANWRLLSRLHASGPVGAVVKADAYGLGAIPVAQALHQAGCGHFFVALLHEALEIRPFLPGAMIAVLDGLMPGMEAVYQDHDLIPVIGTLAELDAWAVAGEAAGRALPTILHVDTGMHRLGLSPREVALLHHAPGRLDGLDVRYVMTHLISSEIAHDPLNERQRTRFEIACTGLPEAPLSFANSSGIFLGERWGSDLARPGTAMYGLNPTPGQPNPMRQVVNLEARVLSVRDVPAGEGVGYNATWHAARASRIATAGVGYADGLHRTLSNRGRAFFDGHPLPLVGRVSMDLTTFDVTDHPAVQAGCWLEIFGPNQSPDDVAAQMGTNALEVLTSLGRRYARVYKPA